MLIRLIDIQFGNMCNRSCWFCPEQSTYKPKEEKKMTNKMQTRVIELFQYMKNKNLIDKNAVCCFNRYYEPLLYHKELSEFMIKVRSVLDNFHLRFASNGDFLDKDSLHLIEHFNSVGINRYDDNEMKSRLFIFKHFGSIKNITKINNKQILNFYYKNTHVSIKYDKTKFFTENNLWNNRGCSIQQLVNEKNIKKECDGPGMILSVDIDGYVFPCCDLHGSIPSQKSANCGNILIDSFEKIFENINNFNIKDHQCCTNCNTASYIENKC